MAQWRKVVVSGSNAVLNEVTASGNIVPKADNGSDLGSSTLEWKDLYIDGTANIDSLVADTADIDGGTVDNATIGANTHTSIKGTTIDATTDFTIGGTVITDNTITDDGTLVIASTTATSFSDGNITNVGDINVDTVSVDDAAVGLDIQFGGNTTLNKITLTDNLADALNINEGGNSYIKFITTNSSEQIVVGKNSTFNGTTIADLGTVTTATSITATDLIGTNVDGILGADTARAITGTTIDATTDFTIDGLVITADTITNDSNLTMDVAGDLLLDVDGGDVTITDGGANLATINATKISGSLASTGSFGRIETGRIDIDSIDGNWTNAGNTVADLGSVTTVDINSGAIDGTAIGAVTHTTIKGTTIDATTDFTIDGLVLTADTITNDSNLTMDLAGDLAIDVDGGDVTITDNGIDLATINATKISGSLASTGSFGALTIKDGVTETLSPIINATVDLGASSNKWKDLYVAGTGSFGSLTNDGAVSVTHLTGSFSGAFAGTFDGADNLVDVSGTPSNNQIPTWTDANTIQGESNLTFDGTDVVVAAGGKVAFRDNGGEYIYSVSDNVLGLAAGSEIDLTATTIDINGLVDISGNLTVGGNLDVNGTVTTIDSTNVMVSESFTTHASGSSTAVDGGIGVQFRANGDTRALGWDASGTRWSLQNDLSYTGSLMSPDAYVSTVETGTGDGDSQGNPTYGGATGYGNIYIDTDDGEIWIFA